MPANYAQICPLVYSLCDQRNVPVLVTNLIAGYLDEQDLLIISTLSRKLNVQAISVIYREIVIDLSYTACSRRKAVLLLRTLLTNRTAASHVRSLVLTGDPLSQWRKQTPLVDDSIEHTFRGKVPPEIPFDLSAFTGDEIEMYQRKTDSLFMTMRTSRWQISLPKLCLDIISLVLRLQDLDISSDYFRYPDFREGLRNIVDLGGLQNLQCSTLCLDVVRGKRRHINVVRDWDDALLTPFLATNIKSITAVITLQPEALSQLRISPITRLNLHHCQVQDFDLNAVLAATTRLSYLEYHASVDLSWYRSRNGSHYGRRRGLGLAPLFDALHHVSDTLKELLTFQKFEEDDWYPLSGDAAGLEPPFREHHEMSKLKHLHKLKIPYASLLGWTRKEGYSWEWHNILPASLRRITLTDDLCENFSIDPWEDESLMPVFSGLLEWLGSSRHGDQRPEFGLLLLQSDDDFNRPVRETLYQLCAKHGILCNIEKLHADRIKPPFVYVPPRGRHRRRVGGRGGRPGTESYT